MPSETAPPIERDDSISISSPAPDRWSPTVRALHWAVAGLLTFLVVGGLLMTEAPTAVPVDSDGRRWLAWLHTGLGLTAGCVMGWRLWRRRQDLLPTPLPLTPRHTRLVLAVHRSLYVVVFSLAVSGMMTALNSDWPRYLGGLVGAPDLHTHPLRVLHEALVWAVLALIAVHIVGVALAARRGLRPLRRILP